MIRKLKLLAWKVFKSSLKKVGVEAFVHQADHDYLPNYYGHSAHKQIDIRRLPEFSPLAEIFIQHGKTLLGYDRLHIIYQALLNLKPLVATATRVCLAEVGVYKGGTSYF